MIPCAPARRAGRTHRPPPAHPSRWWRALALALAGAPALVAALVATGPTAPAGAQTAPVQVPTPPAAPTPTTPPLPGTPAAGGGGGTLDINLNSGERPSKSIVVILVLTVLSIAPSLLVMLTPFTRIVIVLTLARNALGVPSVPPNQVLVGLAMFIGLFVMAPTLREMNDVALQPLLNDQKTEQQAWDAAMVPLHRYLLANTRREELALFVDKAAANGDDRPATPEDVEMTALVPAYVLSELQSAFIIGFVVFVPFLVIDLVVSAVLMSLGMMMLPPVTVSLPFKILLFVMVGGWTLIVETLMRSFT